MKILFFSLFLSSLILACSGGGSGNRQQNSVGDSESDGSPVPSTPPEAPETEEHPVSYRVISTETLDADGEGVGLDAYSLVRNKFGIRPIESPDLYDSDHQTVRHLYEDADDIVGQHFVFVLHRDEDGDRGRFVDRQRNEIKIYGGSRDGLKGYEGKTFEYRWKFKVNPHMEVSSRFSHFFQLKAVYGDDARPIVTISGAERAGSDGTRKDYLQVRYSPYTHPSETLYLESIDFDMARGRWLDVLCRATFAEADSGGALYLSITRLGDTQPLIEVDQALIDMWRGPATDEERAEGRVPFVRPKWGYYRSFADRDNLRTVEESIRFANFDVREVERKSP